MTDLNDFAARASAAQQAVNDLGAGNPRPTLTDIRAVQRIAELEAENEQLRAVGHDYVRVMSERDAARVEIERLRAALQHDCEKCRFNWCDEREGLVAEALAHDMRA